MTEVDERHVGYGSIIPDAPGAESHLLTVSLGEKVGNDVEQYLEAMEKVINAMLANIGLFHTVESEIWMTSNLVLQFDVG